MTSDYERFCAKQREQRPVSWIAGIRERLEAGKQSGVTDITAKTGGVLEPDPLLAQYPNSMPPATDDLMQVHIDNVVGGMALLAEDLQLHNIEITAAQCEFRLSVTTEMMEVLRGEWALVPEAKVDQ